MTLTEVEAPRLERFRGVAFAQDLARHGDSLALASDSERLTYRQLAARVDEVARGLGHGRRLVLVAATNAIDPVVAYLAVLAAGHVALLTSADSPRHVDDLVERYDPDVVLRQVDGAWEQLDRRAGSAHDLHPDLALLLSTSGTTGSPKLVRLSHENLESNAESIAEYLRITSDDRAVTSLPLHYCYGLSVLHSHLNRGAGVIVTELSVVDPCFWDLARAHGATSFAGVPYTFDLLDRVGFDGSEVPTLRLVTQAGGRLAPDRVADFAARGRRTGWDLVVMYGQTEATARMAFLPPGLTGSAPGAIGIAVPGGALRLEPVEGATDDGIGELVYAGPNVMLGYAERAEDLALGREVDELRTGDLARRRTDGLFEIVGRRSRFAKVLGLRVDLDRVESALDAEAIDAVCVDRDDRVVVGVSPAAPVGRVLRVLERDLGVPERAVQVIVLDEVPRTASGKTDYAAVRALAESDADADAAEPAVEDAAIDTAEHLRDAFAVALRRPDATDADTFVGLGGDSLSYVELSIVVERAVGSLPPDWHITPIGELAGRMEHPRTRPEGTRGRWGSFETSVLLRAAAIVAIVGTHVGLIDLRGGAHILLAVAGYNVARFQLTDVARRERVRRLTASTLRIVVPTVVWVGAMLLLTTGQYRWSNLTLMTTFFGSENPDQISVWHYWFVEVLVLFLVVLTLLVSIRRFDAAERRWPLAVPVVILGLALAPRYLDVLDVARGPHTLAASMVLWFFVFGWAAVRTRTTLQRLLLSAVPLVAVPGFFGQPLREAVVIGGLLLLVWVRSIRAPRAVGSVASVLAAASLYIYLVHFQVYPQVGRVSEVLALVASVLAGIAYWQVVTRVSARLTAREPDPRGDERPARDEGRGANV